MILANAAHHSPPEGYDVPPDIRVLLDEYADAFVRRDLQGLLSLLDADFLFLGMRRDHFLRQVEPA